MLSKNADDLINKVVSRTNLLGKLDEGDLELHKVANLMRSENIKDNNHIEQLGLNAAKAKCRMNNALHKQSQVYKKIIIELFNI